MINMVALIVHNICVMVLVEDGGINIQPNVKYKGT